MSEIEKAKEKWKNSWNEKRLSLAVKPIVQSHSSYHDSVESLARVTLDTIADTVKGNPGYAQIYSEALTDIMGLMIMARYHSGMDI